MRIHCRRSQHAHGKLSTIPKFDVNASQTQPVTLQGKGIADSAVKASDMHSALQELETRDKGVDLCILMDGTGSMVSSSCNTTIPEDLHQLANFC